MNSLTTTTNTSTTTSTTTTITRGTQLLTNELKKEGVG